MPYPLLALAALGASAGGAGMQMMGARKTKQAMNDARAAEMTRQQGYQQEAAGAFNESLDKSTRQVAETSLAQGAQRRSAAYNRIGRTASGAPIPTAGRNTTVPGNAPVVNQSAAAWSKLSGGNQAKLGAVGDWQLQQGIKDTRANQSLAVTSANARGSARLMPMEMEAASHAGDELNGWGQILQAVGSVAGMAGAAGGAAGAAGAGASASGAGMAPAAGTPLASATNAGGGSMFAGMFNRPASFMWPKL